MKLKLLVLLFEVTSDDENIFLSIKKIG